MSEASDWIRLTTTPGISDKTARNLLHAFGMPSSIFATSPARLRTVISNKLVAALTAPLSATRREYIQRSVALCSQPGRHLVTLADRCYPAQLLNIPDPPVVLYAAGRIDLLAGRSIAVVGSRNATSQGLRNATHFSRYLADHGQTIVSGLAQGIDAAAHRGGLAGNASTIAVIGTGIDITYPAVNAPLADDIVAAGCVVTEYPPGTPPLAHNFPRRNRIIAGLSNGVLVVEAALQSGSLITARVAAEQGRDVFAIPGSIHATLSKGCHQLIKLGAKLVECGQDILEETSATCQSACPTTASTADAGLLDSMGYDPIHPDELAAQCGLTMQDLSARLTMLELAGQIEILPGGLLRRLSEE